MSDPGSLCLPWGQVWAPSSGRDVPNASLQPSHLSAFCRSRLGSVDGARASHGADPRWGRGARVKGGVFRNCQPWKNKPAHLRRHMCGT